MRREKFLMSGSYYTWRYLIISALRQRPISLMMLLYTPNQVKEMAPVERRERPDISLALNPRFGLQKSTAVLRVLKIMVGFFFPSSRQSHDTGYWSGGGAPWDLSLRTRWGTDTLGHTRESPDAVCPISPP